MFKSSNFLLLSLIFFISACGQQSSVKDSFEPVKFANNLFEVVNVTPFNVSGTCEKNVKVEIISTDIVSPVTLTCSLAGEFVAQVTLVGGDGAKIINVNQTDPAGLATNDKHTVILDQNPPTLANDSVSSIVYATSGATSIISNDSDAGVGLDLASVKIVSSAVNGVCSLTYGAAIGMNYQPNIGFAGTDACIYEVCDLQQQCSNATVSFTVLPGQPIVAANDSIIGTQNFPTSVSITVNDSDPDGAQDINLQSINITSNTNALTEGSCSLVSGNQVMTFNPVTNFFGIAQCTYEICDFESNCDTANVTFTVNDATPPVAVKDTDTMTTGAPPVTKDVSLNDTDPANNIDINSVNILAAVGGTCQFNPAAPFVKFIPNSGFVGLGSCTYQICDTEANCSSSLYEVSVTDGQAPIASNDLGSTQTNVATNPLNVSLNDIDIENRLNPGSVTLLGGDVGGVCSISPSAPFVVFTPTANFVGLGTCTYEICDNDSNCSTAELQVNVVDVLAPVIVDDTASVNQNVATGPIDVSSNDNDPEGNLDTASVTLTGVESGGTCALAAASPNIEFTPAANFAGPGFCTYRICDSFGNCSQGKLNVTVTDITAPTVTIDQLPSQGDPASSMPISFEMVFSEPINTATLNPSDIDKSLSTANGGIISVINSGDNLNFLVMVNALSSDGDLTLTLPAGLVQDVNGVGNIASTSTDNTVSYDGTPPLAPVITGPTHSQNLSPDINVSCEPGTTVQLNSANLVPNPYPALALAPICPGTGMHTFVAVPLAATDGVYPVIPLATDASGNTTQGSQVNITIDNQAPSLVITQLGGQVDPTNQVPIFFQAVFDEPIDPTTFSGGDVSNSGTATGGVWTVGNSGDNQTFTLTVNALTSDGSIIPTIAGSVVTDLAGNNNNAGVSGTDNQVDYDGTVPNAPIITGPFYTQDDTPDIQITCENNEDLELTITGYAANPVTSVCVGGVATITLPASLGVDGVYNILPTAIDGVMNRTDGNVFNLTLDRASPTPTITQLGSQGDPTNSLPIFFIVTFDEPISGSSFSGTDVSNLGTAGGGIWSVANSGDDTTFTLSVNGITQDGTIIPSIAAGFVQDFALNLSNISISGADNSVTYDSVPPSVPVVTGPAFSSSPTPSVLVTCEAGSTITLDIPTYPASPLNAGVCPGGGSLAVVLPSNLPSEAVYAITPTALDSVGNSQSGAVWNLTYDNTQPSVEIQRSASQINTTNSLPIFFDVIFSEAIDPSTFSVADITDSGTSASGVWSISNSGDNTNFTVSVSGLSADGTVQPSIALGLVSDLTGNLNTVATIGANGNVVTYDGSAPGAPSIISPSNTNSLSPSISINCDVGSLIQVSIPGYTPDPFPATPVTCAASPVIIAVSPALSSVGTYALTAIASDSTGNQSVSAPFDMIVDQTGPDVEITRAVSQADLTNSTPIFFDVAFNEPIDVASFSSADIVNNGTLGSSGTWTVANSGDNQNFTISISGLTADGTIEPSIAASKIQDLAGNNNTASTTPGAGDPDVEYDGTAPGVPSVSNPRYTSNATPTIDVSCDTGSLIQLSISNYTPDPFPAAPVTCVAGAAQITLTSALPSNDDYTILPIASDPSGNTVNGSNYTMTYDTIKPNVTVAKLVTQNDPTNQLPVYFQVIFDEPIDAATFSGADITSVGTLTTGVWSVSNTGDNQNFIVSVTAVNGEGTLEASVLAGVVADPTGNLNNASTVAADPDVEFDNVPPDTNNIITWTWGLTPLNGSISSNTQPDVFLSAANIEENGSVQIFEDVNCVNLKGSSQVINAGAATVSDISFAADGSEDGLKTFFVKITDEVGNVSPCTPTGLSYTMDTISPNVIVNQSLVQLDPSKSLPVIFDVEFNEVIDPSTFTASDIVNSGTISAGVFTVQNQGDNKNFKIFFDEPNIGGTIVITIPGGSVEDIAGNLNTSSTTSDNSVLLDITKPDTILDLYYGPVTQTTADLFWNIPNDNGTPIIRYHVEFKLVASPTWTEAGTSTDPLYTVIGLTPNTEYQFRVRTYNGLYSDYSNIEQVFTKPVSPFFDPADYKVINISGAIDSQVVALEDGTDVYILDDITDTPVLLASLNQTETHRFASTQGQILVSTKPIFCAGRKGPGTGSIWGNGNPAWVSPLWAERELLMNRARRSPQQIYVFAFENNIDVSIYSGATVVASATNIPINTMVTLDFTGTGSYRIEATGFIVAAGIGDGGCCADDMPALPKSKRLLGYPSNAGYLATVGTGVNAAIYHSNGYTLAQSLSAGTFLTISPQGSVPSLYRSEAIYIEADDLVSGNNTADSNGGNSAPFAPIQTMMRRYGINVLADYVAFASTEAANVKMIKPDGTEATFQLARTGTGPFAAKSPYKYYLNNVAAGTVFEGISVTDRFSVWYQPENNTAGAQDDETIIYGYK